MRKSFTGVPVPPQALHESEPRGQTCDKRPQQPYAFHTLGAVDVDGCKKTGQEYNTQEGSSSPPMKCTIYFYLTSICRWSDRSTRDIESPTTQAPDSLAGRPAKSPQNPRRRTVRIIYVPITYEIDDITTVNEYEFTVIK